MKHLIATLIIVMSMLASIQAHAYTKISFPDNSLNWPGFGDNPADVIGNPDLGDVTFTFDGNKLIEIYLAYTATSVAGLAPGDWFFDTDQDGWWDIVLTSSAWGLNRASLDTANSYKNAANFDMPRRATSWDAYAVSLQYNIASNYIMSFAPKNWDRRKSHPALAKTSGNETHLADFTLDNVFTANSNNPAIWSTSGLNFTDTKFNYAFAMTCANDVLYHHAPEPGTALMLGFGLLGLGAMARRRR